MSGERGLSIMVWSAGLDSLERSATPFVVAQAAAALDLRVEMLFTAQAVKLLLRASQESEIGFGAGRLALHHHVEACVSAGVRLYACSQALAALGAGRDDLVPACSGLGGTVSFVERTQDPQWRTLVF